MRPTRCADLRSLPAYAAARAVALVVALAVNASSRAIPALHLLAALVVGLVIGSVEVPPARAAQPPDLREAVDVGGLEARSAALVLSGQQGGDLAASVLVVPVPGRSSETVRLVLIVDLDAGSLVLPATPEEGGQEGGGEEEGGRQDSEGTGSAEEAPDRAETRPLVTEVHAYAVGPDDALVAHLTQAFALETEELAGKAGVKFLGVLEVPPGEWSVRLLVRQRNHGRLALRAIPVTAPDFASTEPGEPVLLPPLFPDPPERWILVRSAGPAPPFPLDLRAAGAGDGWLVPSTRPVIEPGGRAFFLVGRDLLVGSGGAPPGEPAAWTARTYEAGTEPLGGSEEPRVSEEAPGETTAFPRMDRIGSLDPGGMGGGLELWGADLDPDPLVPGAGVLVVTAPVGAHASLPAVVIPPRLAPAGSTLTAVGTRLWTDFLEASASVPVPTPPEPRTVEAAEITDEEMARFQASYLEALGHLATGDRLTTLTAVMEVEKSGFARGTATERLARGQLQVAFDVSGGAAERLLPLIQLHQELYREHRERGRPSLAAHARRVTLGLVELYSQHSEDADRGRVAAAALVGLAAELLEYGNTLEAISVLSLALEHDPDHPPALLTLADIYELLGDYPETVGLLRRLEKVAPDTTDVGAEARLRLGVNLARTGARRAAVGYLEASLASDRPRWIRAVAYEELAVLHAGQGELGAAAELLEEAVERMPGQQRFYIQLSAMYESLGEPAAARAVLDRLEERVRRRPGRDRDSPRLRYSQWPEQALESSRRLFEKAAMSRMTALAEALADFTARGG